MDVAIRGIKTNNAAKRGAGRHYLRNAFIAFAINWCKRMALRFSSLRYLTLS